MRCFCGWSPPPYVILASTSRPPDVTHVMDETRPSLFFHALPLPCIILNANRKQKNGWDHQMVHGVMRVTLKQPIRVRGSPSNRQLSLSPAKPNNGVCVCVCTSLTPRPLSNFLPLAAQGYHDQFNNLLACIPSFFPDVTSHNFPSPSCLSFLYCQQWEAG